MIKVTNVYSKNFKKGSLRGFADVEFEGSLVVKGFKVFENEQGFFAVPPSSQGKDGEWYPTITFKDDDAKKEVLVDVVKRFRSRSESTSSSTTNKPKPNNPDGGFDTYLNDNWP